MSQADWLMLLVMHQPFEIKWAIRVKSGKYGHQVNSDTHLQTVNPDETAPYEPSHQDFHCLVNLFFIPIFEIWNKQGHCLSLAVCPNIPDFTLLKGRSISIQIRKKMDLFHCASKNFCLYMCSLILHVVWRWLSGTRWRGMFLAQGGREWCSAAQKTRTKAHKILFLRNKE